MFERTTANGQVLLIVAAKGQQGYAFYINDVLEFCDYDKSMMRDRLADDHYEFSSEWIDWLSNNG
jgi:hypothetical protein